MKILGIDPGYGRLGYAVFEKNGSFEKLLEFSCIETSSKKSKNERFMEIADSIENLIKNHKADILVIEKVFFTKNQKTVLEIAEIRGIIIYLSLKHGLDILEYTPLQVKSAVCGYGKATKEQVQKMVSLILKIEKKPKFDDTSDAIALCLACASNKAFLDRI